MTNRSCISARVLGVYFKVVGGLRSSSTLLSTAQQELMSTARFCLICFCVTPTFFVCELSMRCIITANMFCGRQRTFLHLCSVETKTEYLCNVNKVVKSGSRLVNVKIVWRKA